MLLRFLVPSAAVLLVIAGLVWSPESANTTEASQAQPMSMENSVSNADIAPDGGSQIGPALFDPCVAADFFASQAGVLMVLGLEHQAFIALALAIDARMYCNSMPQGLQDFFIAGPDTPAPPREVTIEGQAGSNFVPVTGMFDPSTGLFEGEGVGTVAGFPNVTVEMEMQVQENGDFEATYTMGANGELPGGNPGVYEITGTFDLSSLPTPTPSPDPTPTPSTTDPGGQEVVWGNWNCSGDPLDPPDPVDALLNLRDDAGLSTNTGDCPDMGSQQSLVATANLIWGDGDCSGAADPVDALKILRVDSGLNAAQEPDCPEYGSTVMLALG